MLTATALLAATALSFSAGPAHGATEPGALLSVTPVASLSRPATAKALRSAGLPGARYGISAVRLRYRTGAVDGTPTSATALAVLPRSARRRLVPVAYLHGTLARRRDAPSQGLDSLASGAAVLYGSAGFATVAPDYLGLGGGPGKQAYLHAATEASASVDALRAARTYVLRRHRRLGRRVLVTGFSQGGHAAMALGRALQDGADRHLSLRALAPVSGPLNLEHAELPALLDGRLDARISAYNLSGLLLSWQPIYHLFATRADAFSPPYADRVGTLFDGHHGDRRILAAMPARISGLLTTTELARLRQPTGGLLTGLRENDATCEWSPRVPVRLYAARGDRAVTIANSRQCADDLAAHGVTAPVRDLGPIDHFPSMFAATPRVLAWFQALAREPAPRVRR